MLSSKSAKKRRLAETQSSNNTKCNDNHQQPTQLLPPPLPLAFAIGLTEHTYAEPQCACLSMAWLPPDLTLPGHKLHF